MKNPLDMQEMLPDLSWLDEQAALEPDREHAEAEQAIAAHKDACKKNEVELLDLISAVKMKPSDIEEENRMQVKFAEELAKKDEEESVTKFEADDIEIIQQLMLESSIESSIDIQTVTGGRAGRYYDYNPYSAWGRWYTHNEGGFTKGTANYNKAARKMYPYASARGDGSGISDDNDVTTWTKFNFFFWPRQTGHVRAYVPYYIRGYYRIYANDKWYNSKEARVDLDVHVRLYQNYWGADVRDDAFSRFDDNINQRGRIDLNRSLYSSSLAVGANKWVRAEVAVRARVETEGSGSTAKLDFTQGSDSIFVPYVRFDFS